MGLTTENDHGVYRNRKRMLFDNFLGGMMWSLGTLIGGAIIVLIAGVIISQIDIVPIIGSWLHDVLQETFKAQPGVKGISFP